MRSILAGIACLAALAACQQAGSAVQSPGAPSSVSATSPDASSPASAATPEKPWKANLKWIVTRLEWPEGQPPFSGVTSTFGGRCSVQSDYVIYARFEGQATHAGLLRGGEGSHCSQLHLGPAGPTNITYTDGKGALVTANGSTVALAWGNGTTWTDEKGVTFFKDQFQVTGGSGTFEGATGGGTEGGSFTDFIALLGGAPLAMWQEGTIVYKPGKGN